MLNTKQALRRVQRARRAKVSANQRERWSRSAAEHLFQSPLWISAQTVGLFLSLPEELDTGSLVTAALAANKRVAVPRVMGRGLALAFFDPYAVIPPALARGAFGVQEPDDRATAVALPDLDLLLTPGLAFDRSGRRLGYGGGYYDRTLVGVRCPVVFAAYAMQEVGHVPVSSHDVPVPYVLTEAGLQALQG